MISVLLVTFILIAVGGTMFICSYLRDNLKAQENAQSKLEEIEKENKRQELQMKNLESSFGEIKELLKDTIFTQSVKTKKTEKKIQRQDAHLKNLESNIEEIKEMLVTALSSQPVKSEETEKEEAALLTTTENTIENEIVDYEEEKEKEEEGVDDDGNGASYERYIIDLLRNGQPQSKSRQVNDTKKVILDANDPRVFEEYFKA